MPIPKLEDFHKKVGYETEDFVSTIFTKSDVTSPFLRHPIEGFPRFPRNMSMIFVGGKWLPHLCIAVWKAGNAKEPFHYSTYKSVISHEKLRLYDHKNV